MLSGSEKLALESYLDKLKSATAERAKLTKQIKRYEDAVRGILATTEDGEEIATYQEKLDDIIEPTGFTDAIRKVLQGVNGEALTAMEVRDALPSVGFSLSGYSNPLASVYTILKRLGKSAILYNVEVVEKDGKAAYRWVSMGERMIRDMQIKATTSAVAGKPGQAPILPNIMRRPATVPPPPTDNSPEDAMRKALGRKKHPPFYGGGDK